MLSHVTILLKGKCKREDKVKRIGKNSKIKHNSKCVRNHAHMPILAVPKYFIICTITENMLQHVIKNVVPAHCGLIILYFSFFLLVYCVCHSKWYFLSYIKDMTFITNLVFHLHFITPVEHNKEIVSAQQECYIKVAQI